MPYYPDSCPRIWSSASALISLSVSSFPSIGISPSLGSLQVLFLRVVNRIYGRPSTNGTDAILRHIRRKKRATTQRHPHHGAVAPSRAANRHFDTKTHKHTQRYTHTDTQAHTRAAPCVIAMQNADSSLLNDDDDDDAKVETTKYSMKSRARLKCLAN